MSMSDLELLQLVDSVKEKQRGPVGPAGVGIEQIEQFDETGFTIRLTDGSFKRIALPAAKDGEPGPVGPAGPAGEKGSTGRAGRDGAQGPSGRDGADGLAGSSLETAVVNSNGHLLLGISDGSIVDVGRVIGPAGSTGERGATGLPGEPGRDGAAVLSGPRAPQASDGVEGDHWIDISSAEFGFFKKSGDGWTKLANLRQPARDPRVGPVVPGGGTTGSGGGGGGGAEVHVGPEAPSFPAVGELWFDTNDAEGRMYVWTGSSWEPVLPQPDLDGYATQGYVDAKTAELPYLIETDKTTTARTGDVRSGEAEIVLVDNKDNYSNVKFVGTNGVDVSSTASSIVIDGSKLSGDITAELTNFATIAYSDGKDQDLQNQIDDLETQKGAAANYDCKAVSGSYNARPGEIDFNNATASSVTLLGLGLEDKSGNLTKTINVGDIIEIVGPTGADTRYKATDVSGAPIIVLADFVSGEQTFALEQQYTVFIYPQNEAAASKDYVDAQDDLKLDKAGGTVTGPLIADGSVTMNANSVYNGASPDENSLVTRKYVDDAVSTGGDFLPITGGKMLGNIEFEGSSQIKAKGTSNLDGRASLVISGAADKPVAIDSGSSYLPALSIFGYDASQPNNRKQVLDLKANGRIDTIGAIVSTNLIKSTRNTGYAFEAKPDDSATTAFIHNTGNAQFNNTVEIKKAKTTDHEGLVIYGTVSDGTEGKLLSSFHNTDPLPDAVNYLGKIEQPKNIVNKGYVDSMVGPKPAQLQWQWDGDKGSTTTAPPIKKFLRSSSSGTDYIRFNFESYNGVDLGGQRFSDTNVTFSDGPIGTIWYLDTPTGVWRLKMQFRCSSWRWNYNAGGGAHFEFGLSSRNGRNFGDLTQNSLYYVTVGGFF